LNIPAISSGLVSCLIKAPGFGENQKRYLEDIAIFTGAEYISKELGMTFEHVTIDKLGSAEKVKVTPKNTIIVSGAGDEDKIDQRVESLKRELAVSTSEYDSDKLRARIGKLRGGIVTVKVGAVSEASMKELKARIEDALSATRAAVSGGVVPGGGLALVNAAAMVIPFWADAEMRGLFAKTFDCEEVSWPQTDDEHKGFGLVMESCRKPFLQILSNAGHNGDVYLERLAQDRPDEAQESAESEESPDYVEYGYDVRTMQLVNMYEAGILDAAKVVRSALTNAVSIAGVMLTCECGVMKPKKSDTSDPM
jgi:chaperonin GroEL